MWRWRILYKVRWEFHNRARAALACSVRITPECACTRAAETWPHPGSAPCSITSHTGVDFEVFSTAVLHNKKGHLLGDGWWWSILTDSHILTSEHPLRHGSAILTPDDRLTRGVRPRQLTCNDKRIVISDGFDIIHLKAWQTVFLLKKNEEW